jgi:hypothetical protein
MSAVLQMNYHQNSKREGTADLQVQQHVRCCSGLLLFLQTPGQALCVQYPS